MPENPEHGYMSLESKYKQMENKMPKNNHTNNEANTMQLSYPVESFPKTARSFILETARSMGVDDSMIGSTVLPVIAGLIGNSARFTLKAGFIEIAPIWMLAVAPSGSTKSPAQKAIMDFLESIQNEADDLYKMKMSEYEKENKLYKAKLSLWKKAFAKGQEMEMPEEPKKPVPVCLLMNDASICSVIENLNQYRPGSILYKDELSGMFRRLDSGRGNEELEHMLSMFNGKTIRYSRKGRETLVVPTPSFGIVGTIQPEVLQGILKPKSSLITSGLFARFMVHTAEPDTVPWDMNTISVETRNAFADQVKTIYAMRRPGDKLGKPLELSLSPDALIVWEYYWNNNGVKVKQSDNDIIRAGLVKMKSHTARIAITLHILKCLETGRPFSKWTLEVDGETMENAICLADWHENEMYKVITIIQGKKIEPLEDAEVILGKLQQSTEGMTIREMQRACGRHFSQKGGAGVIERELRQLCHLNVVKVRIETVDANHTVERFYPFGDNDGSINVPAITLDLSENEPDSVDTMSEKAGKDGVNVDERSLFDEFFTISDFLYPYCPTEYNEANWEPQPLHPLPSPEFWETVPTEQDDLIPDDSSLWHEEYFGHDSEYEPLDYIWMSDEEVAAYYGPYNIFPETHPLVAVCTMDCTVKGVIVDGKFETGIYRDGQFIPVVYCENRIITLGSFDPVSRQEEEMAKCVPQIGKAVAVLWQQGHFFDGEIHDGGYISNWVPF